MEANTKRMVRAGALLVATTIGGGIFGIPYAMVQGGTAIGIAYFLFIGFVIILFNLLYGEVVLRTRGQHRLPGFAAIYLGPWGKRIAIAADVIGIYGTQTAYLIIGGVFLRIVLESVFGRGDAFWSTVFFLVIAAVTFFGLRVVTRVEYWLTWAFLLAILVITVWAMPHASFENLIEPGGGNIFLPYGVIFFSLVGSTAIPIVRDALGSQVHRYRQVIFWASLISIVFTAIFALVVLAVSGPATSDDSIRGLRVVMGEGIAILGSGFGLLSILTTAISLALYLQELYHYDLKWNRTFSWFLAVVVPYLAFALFSPNFIHTIAITGAVVGGFEGILIALIHRRAKTQGARNPEYSIRMGAWVGNMLMLLFALGILAEMYAAMPG